MRVLVEVVDRPLALRHTHYNVGERLWLDTDNLQHVEVLEEGWVRRLAPDTAHSPAVAALASAAAPGSGLGVLAMAFDGPPADKMVRPKQARQKS